MVGLGTWIGRPGDPLTYRVRGEQVTSCQNWIDDVQTTRTGTSGPHANETCLKSKKKTREGAALRRMAPHVVRA